MYTSAVRVNWKSWLIMTLRFSFRRRMASVRSLLSGCEPGRAHARRLSASVRLSTWVSSAVIDPKGVFFVPTEMIERWAIIIVAPDRLLVRLLTFGSGDGPAGGDGLRRLRLICGMMVSRTVYTHPDNPSQPPTL